MSDVSTRRAVRRSVTFTSLSRKAGGVHLCLAGALNLLGGGTVLYARATDVWFRVSTVYARRYVTDTTLLGHGGLLDLLRVLLPVLGAALVLLGLFQFYAGRRAYGGTGQRLAAVVVLAGVPSLPTLPVLGVAAVLLYASRGSFEV